MRFTSINLFEFKNLFLLLSFIIKYLKQSVDIERERSARTAAETNLQLRTAELAAKTEEAAGMRRAFDAAFQKFILAHREAKLVK